jgi:protein-tyrosine phosphatase
VRNSSIRKNTANMAGLALGICVLINPSFGSEFAPERALQLDGTSNTRDIGGYQNGDRRTIRWRQIIRSENLSRLTADDFRTLEALGVKTVIDLRTDREHDKEPTVWLGDHPPGFFHFPIGDAQNDWFKAQRQMIKSNRFTEERSLQHAIEGYRMIAGEGPASLRHLMDLVLDPSNWPILIHCNAGKDRAGVATALILEAVGVDRETIMEDFLLTNEMGHAKEKAAFQARERQRSSKVGRRASGPTADAWFPIVGVRPEMLEAFYASVDQRYGSMDAFLAELGVDQESRSALEASLTTEEPSLAIGK